MRSHLGAYEVLKEWTAGRKPDCSFAGRTPADVQRWQRAFRRRYRRRLGPWPESIPLRLQFGDETDCGGCLLTRITFDSSPGVRVPAYLLMPKGLRRSEKRPALLAAHGHGNGKDDMVGISRATGDRKKVAWVKSVNYEYALEAVRRGYVVIAPDWCPFGERRPPQAWGRTGQRDPCNVVGLAWQYFGRPLLTQNIWDGMRAIDVLARHPHVDPRRIGVIGLSFGGTMAIHLIVNDSRVRAGVVSAYATTVRAVLKGQGNFCGAQHLPGLLRHGDLPEVFGLAVPKPILLEIGKKDTTFPITDGEEAYRHIKSVYEAARCSDRLARDVHSHGHRWHGVAAWKWLEKWL